MEDGLLLCCLCSSSLPIRRISIAQFHPPITRMERQHAARHEGIKREWSFACARFAVGCGIEVCFSRNAPLFFYDKSAAEAALTVF